MNLILPSLDFKVGYKSKVCNWHHHLHFAYDLIANVRPRTLVELGVHYGDSYFTFCQSIKEQEIECQCYGVDHWTGDVHSGFYDEEVWNIVSNYNQANYYFSHLIRKEFSHALKDFEDLSIDLLHLDGCHTYEAIKHDFYSWFPKVSDKGIILLHDIYEKGNGFGVWKLWEELKLKFKTFSFSFGHGLGVIFKNDDFAKDNKYIKELIYSESLNLYYKSKSINSANKDIIIPDKSTVFQDDQISNRSIHQGIILTDKIKRMQKSLSWRVTAPLRFLRRKTLDRFFRKDSFDARLYLQLNPDLQKIFGSDFEAAKNHFRKWGKKQGRMYVDLQEHISYSDWVCRFDTNDFSKLEKFRYELADIDEQPLLSIILPIFNSELNLLKSAVKSVFDQVYHNWELILVDDYSNCNKLNSFLNEIEKTDRRVRLIRRNRNGHIAAACNSGLEVVTGKFFAVLDHDDLLREHTLLRICQAISRYPNCKIVYSDEDKIDLKGARSSPHFKPDWNPELLLSQNYICHTCFLDTDYIKSLDGYRVGYEGCQDWDLFLRASEKLEDNQIIHIPEILYHWRKTKQSTATRISAKNYVYENSLKVIKSAWDRRGISVTIESTGHPNNYVRTKFIKPKVLPLVSIIIPTRDNLEHLEKCINGLINKTSYDNFEILIMNHNSKNLDVLYYLNRVKRRKDCRVIDVQGEFNFSKFCNLGVHHSAGQLVLFLNDDVEPITPNWLSEMVSIASRKEIGCVGAKLLYPNDTIQHAGIILGIRGFAGHAFRGFPKSHPGYFSRLDLVQNYSAVTGACLIVRKEVFLQALGFNEDALKIAFNDVDLCLKVLQNGFKNVWTPYALLYHYESASRGHDLHGLNYRRFLKEGDYIRNTWKHYLVNDPAYNTNLSLYREDFSISLPRKSNP